MMPPTQARSLRLRLSLLVAGTMLPMMMFAIGLIYLNHQQDREVAFDGVLQTVRSMRLVLDSEVNAITASLTVLALSQALQRGDIEGFRQNAQAFVDRYPNESALSLADRDGHQLLNTRVPAGEPLPSRQNRAGTEAVFRTGHPVYSHVFVGSVARVPIITIDVPVLHGAEVVYLLSFNPPLSMFQRIVEQQRPSEEWTASIFDQDGVHIARVPNPEQIVGKRASPSLYDQMMKTNEAKVNTTTIEGQHVLTAFTRSPLTGWIVVAGVSTSTITVPLWRTLAVTGAIGALLLAVGLFFAIGMATRIARAEALHGLLVNELNHRVKNTLATVQSIATQTFRTNSDSAEAQRKFSDRLVALGQTHGLLSEANWEGADVGGVAQRVLEPYATEPGRVRATGPEILMPSAQALMLSMVFHELATNAVKYGALSSSSGRIVVEWQREGNELALTWREQGGPPAHEPTQTGFGSRLITRGLAGSGGTAEMAYNESGLVCTIRCPIRAG